MTFNLAVFTPPEPLRVSYAYVFSGEYGGGTYVRAPDLREGSVTLNVGDFRNRDSKRMGAGCR